MFGTTDKVSGIDTTNSSGPTRVTSYGLQPDPKREGVEVSPFLINWILENNFITKETKTKVVSLIEERYEYGLEKYGQPLMSKDGRNTITDAMDEIGDFLQYLYKAKMNGLNLRVFKDFLTVASHIITDSSISSDV